MKNIAGALMLIWVVWMPLKFYFQEKGKKALSLVFKSAGTMVAVWVAGQAVLAEPGGAGGFALWIFGGLVVCTFADVLLEIRFEVGGVLFFIGHVLYCFGFLAEYTFMPISCMVFLAALALLTGYLHRFRANTPRRLFVSLSVYAVLLSVLLAVSLPPPFAAFGERPVLGALGTALFVASDMLLLCNRVRKRGISARYLSLGLYYTGQLSLALSALLY